MRAINVDDFIFDLDRIKAIANSDSKTVSLIEKLQYMINEYEGQHPIEVEPVRHGYWQDGGCYEICSVCGADHDRYDDGGYLQDFAYCPACGAKMDAEGPTNE